MALSKDRRQLEILALALAKENRYSVSSLAAMFRVRIITIHRDLNDLRRQSIPIHSVKGTVQLDRKLTDKEIQMLLTRYLSTVGDVIGHPKNIALTVKKLKESALSSMAALVNAISRRRRLRIKYYKMYDGETVERDIEPYELIPTTRDWRLVARSDNYYKQFIVENIVSITPLRQSFVRDEHFSSTELFKNSIGYWSGGEEHEVILQFDQEAARIIANEVWHENQELEKLSDGSLRLRMKTNSLEQVGDWALTWGGQIEIVAPQALKDYVLGKAQSLLTRHRTGR